MLKLIRTAKQIPLAHAFHHRRFKGVYYLVGFCSRIKDGQHFIEIRLSDASDNLLMYCFDQSCISGELQPNSLVNIEANIDVSADLPYFRCKFIAMASGEQGQLKSLIQLPIELTDSRALYSFFTVLQSVKDPRLVSFVEQVLLQPDIGVRFIQCPASLRHHHNYAAGLLIHSVEVAQCFAFHVGLSEQERDLGIVASLLHDVGKTLTSTPHLTRTLKGQAVSHDDLTLEICATALASLEQSHEGLAIQLRHIWTCATPGARYGFKAKGKVAKLLQEFDQSSAKGHLNIREPRRIG